MASDQKATNLSNPATDLASDQVMGLAMVTESVAPDLPYGNNLCNPAGALWLEDGSYTAYQAPDLGIALISAIQPRDLSSDQVDRTYQGYLVCGTLHR